MNSSFEEPDTGPLPSTIFIDQSYVPGWKTTASSELIEIWAANFNGVAAYDGQQHVQVSADELGTLYQDVYGINAGENLGFEFAHRAPQLDRT
ncbi:MAG: hypothetical protein R3C03_23130 [Pirellulaceae bacterium]